MVDVVIVVVSLTVNMLMSCPHVGRILMMHRHLVAGPSGRAI
jgi:hypothetical protein